MVRLSKLRLAAAAVLLIAGFGYGACSGKTKPPVYVESYPDASTGGRASGGIGGVAGTDASIGGNSANGGGGGADADATPTNCGISTCHGHSSCDNDACKCDPGYTTDTKGECTIVDESCIKIVPLEDGCREAVFREHAVAMFFSVEYCAGTAVLRSKLAQLAAAAGGAGGGTGAAGAAGAGADIAPAFKVTEGGKPLSRGEQWYGIYPRTVESYLTLLIDVSSSLSGDDAGRGRLGELINDLRTVLVPHLSPGTGVKVDVFGANVVEVVPFTTDPTAVDAALGRVLTDLPNLAAQAYTSSTALYRSTYKAIDETQRIRQLRAAVSGDGVLTTGTVVVITDGVDDSGVSLDTTRINNSPIHVISMGLGDVGPVDKSLSGIGKSGSFLVPTPTDWQDAFTEIATRIDQYPDSAYLMAFCSAAVSGTTPTVEIALNGIAAKQTAGCQTNGSLFSWPSAPACNAAFFEHDCDNRECGGFLACNACGASQCCAQEKCLAPAPARDCQGQNELCAPSTPTQVCVSSSTSSACSNPKAVGDACGCTGCASCDPGKGYCDATTKTCKATAPTGTLCTTGSQCESQNCYSPNLLTGSLLCQNSPALAYDACSGTFASATCELGASCSNGKCKPRLADGRSCTTGSDCASGTCEKDSHYCVPAGTCHWDWASKIGLPPP